MEDTGAGTTSPPRKGKSVSFEDDPLNWKENFESQGEASPGWEAQRAAMEKRIQELEALRARAFVFTPTFDP